MRSVKSSVASGSRWMTGHEHGRRPPLDLEECVGDLGVEGVVADRRAAIGRAAARRRGGENPPPNRGAAQPSPRPPGNAKKAPPDQRPGAPSFSSAIATSSSVSARVSKRLEPAAHREIGLQPAGLRLRREAQRMLRPGRDDVADIGAEASARAPRPRPPPPSRPRGRARPRPRCRPSRPASRERDCRPARAAGSRQRAAPAPRARSGCRDRTRSRRRRSGCRSRRNRAGSSAPPAAPAPALPACCDERGKAGRKSARACAGTSCAVSHRPIFGRSPRDSLFSFVLGQLTQFRQGRRIIVPPLQLRMPAA